MAILNFVNRKETVIGEVDKGNNKKLKVRIIEATDSKGVMVNYADIRTFEQGRKNPFATHQGITVAPSKMDELIKLLDEAKVRLDGLKKQAPAQPVQQEADDESI